MKDTERHNYIGDHIRKLLSSVKWTGKKAGHNKY